MANVILVLDEDPNRRAEFLARAKARIAPVADLSISHAEGDGWAAVWAAAASTPVSVVSDGATATMVWGEAIDPSGRRLGAEEAGLQLRQDPSTTWDGFHLAIDVTGIGALTASVDIMGLMPFYHWQGRGVVLAGTSVDAFRAHPAFHADLDAAGLVGILLMNGQVGGRTLWNGVRRLGVRRQLRVRDWKASEAESFSLPRPDPSLLALPVEGHVEIMGGVLQDAFERQFSPGQPHGLLLSGGLDSRQIGGFLADRGIPLHALTFGLDRDIEMRCAKTVAKALGASHETAEIPASAYPGAARSLLEQEGLAAGFCNVLEWGMIPQLGRLPSRVALGHVFDGVVGGIHIPWAYDPGTGKFSAETIFKRFNRWGFHPDKLRELLTPDVHPLIDQALDEIWNTYESSSDQPNLKAWHFDLLTRQRFHVGSAVWPTTFRTWPVSPIFDREVFGTAASMPASSIGDRRLQMELLAARHPHLASIALDRNSFDSTPIRATLRDRLRGAIDERRQLLLARTRLGRSMGDTRFYYRTYDFDSPGWIGIRESAEAHRHRMPNIFRPGVVDRILPRPDQPLGAQDRIIDSSTSKLLVGIALAGDHFGLY